MDEGIKRLGPNRYAVRVHVVDNRTGKRVNRKATVTGPLKEARRVKAELLAAVQSSASKPARIRLQEYARSWLEQRASRLKPSVIKKYCCARSRRTRSPIVCASTTGAIASSRPPRPATPRSIRTCSPRRNSPRS